VAEQEVELAILSAMAHGNGPDGLAVLQATVGALARLDREHAGVYLHIIWNALADAMQKALEALAMEVQLEGKATFPPFAQKLIDRGFRDGLRDGKLEGLREVLVRLAARAGITLTEGDRARIEACEDAATLDQWVENVLGAKRAADVFG
jgi:hypothetical protein